MGTLGIGIIPATGCGYRMMWYPFKGAFRAGTTDDGGACNYWDDANIGFYSWAGGNLSRAIRLRHLRLRRPDGGERGGRRGLRREQHRLGHGGVQRGRVEPVHRIHLRHARLHEHGDRPGLRRHRLPVDRERELRGGPRAPRLGAGVQRGVRDLRRLHDRLDAGQRQQPVHRPVRGRVAPVHQLHEDRGRDPQRRREHLERRLGPQPQGELREVDGEDVLRGCAPCR
jgi:hypothetical protein